MDSKKNDGFELMDRSFVDEAKASEQASESDKDSTKNDGIVLSKVVTGNYNTLTYKSKFMHIKVTDMNVCLLEEEHPSNPGYIHTEYVFPKSEVKKLLLDIFSESYNK